MRRNPTRYIPDQPGFVSLSRADVKRDMREFDALKAPNPPSSKEGGKGAAVVAFGGTFGCKSGAHPMEAQLKPQAPPESVLSKRFFRLQRWAQQPELAAEEIKRIEAMVSSATRELQQNLREESADEYAYAGQRAHYLALLRLLKSAGSDHDEYVEHLYGRASECIAASADSKRRRSSQAMQPQEMVSLAVKTASELEGLREEIADLRSQEARLLAALGEQAGSGDEEEPPAAADSAAEDGVDAVDVIAERGAALLKVGDLVRTPYGFGFLEDVGGWDAALAPAAGGGRARVQLGFGVLYCEAAALKGAVVSPAELSDELLGAKWKALCGPCASLAPRHLLAFDGLALDHDSGAPAEAEALARDAAAELEDRVLPSGRRPRDLRPAADGQEPRPTEELQQLRLLCARLDENGGHRPPLELVRAVGAATVGGEGLGAVLLAEAEAAAALAADGSGDDVELAVRTRGRRYRRYGDSEDDVSSHEGALGGAAGASSAGGAARGTPAGIDAQEGILLRDLGETERRCRERLLPLFGVLEDASAEEDREAFAARFRRAEDCAKGEAEELRYGGASAVPAEGFATLAEELEGRHAGLRERSDRRIKAYQLRAELEREHARVALLPKMCSQPVLKRMFEHGRKRLENLEDTLIDLAAELVDEEDEDGDQKQMASTPAQKKRKQEDKAAAKKPKAAAPTLPPQGAENGTASAPGEVQDKGAGSAMDVDEPLLAVSSEGKAAGPAEQDEAVMAAGETKDELGELKPRARPRRRR